jgi:protein-tyrosine phosphatase
MPAMQTVLFLCSGNYYRSRFAEAVFNHLAARDGLHWRAESRALRLNAGNVGPISPHAVDALRRRSIAIPPPRFPSEVTEADLRAASRRVAVKRAEHLPMIERAFPAWVDRIEFWHIADVDCSPPDAALSALERQVVRLALRLAE